MMTDTQALVKPRVIRYFMMANARTIRGHWEVWEVLEGEKTGKMVRDFKTQREAKETINKLNARLTVIR